MSFTCRSVLPAMTVAIVAVAGPVAVAPIGAAVPTKTVTIKVETRFDPTAVTVEEGDTVVFKNTDTAQPHNVVAADGAFNFPMVMKGKSVTWTANKIGAHKVTCTLHPGQTMTLTVVKPK